MYIYICIYIYAYIYIYIDIYIYIYLYTEYIIIRKYQVISCELQYLSILTCSKIAEHQHTIHVSAADILISASFLLHVTCNIRHTTKVQAHQKTSAAPCRSVWGALCLLFLCLRHMKL